MVGSGRVGRTRKHSLDDRAALSVRAGSEGIARGQELPASYDLNISAFGGSTGRSWSRRRRDVALREPQNRAASAHRPR